MTGKSLKALIEAEVSGGQLILPVFNRTALQLQWLTKSDTTTVDQILKVLMQDQVLASRLLMLANSAFYSGLKQVDTISAAVIRLGTAKVGNLAIVAAQSMAHKAIDPLIVERMPALWRRSFASAIGSEWLAKEARLDVEPESAFLCCLLHDVGELYLLKVVDNLKSESPEADLVTPELLDEIIDSMHHTVGHDVMLQWGLPEKFARVARDHHAAEFDSSDVLLSVCRLMDQACLKLGIGGKPGADFSLAATLEAQALGLSEIRLAQLEIYLEDALKEMTQHRRADSGQGRGFEA